MDERRQHRLCRRHNSCASYSPVEAVASLQQVSDKVQVWAESNHMRIQPDKVCWILVSLSHLDQDLFTLTYKGQPVRQDTQVMYLGEVRDAMTQHIAHTAMKAKSALGVVRYAAS